MKISTPITKLPRLLDPLASFLSQASQQNSYYEFFHNLCEHIMPFILRNPILENLRAKWELDRQEHLLKIKKLERATKRQAKEWHAKLINCIANSGIRDDEYITVRLNQIDDLLNNREPYYTPPEYEVAHDVISNICTYLVKKGKASLIPEFVNIAYLEKENIDKEPYITLFKFAPARWELRSALDTLSNYTSLEPFWVVYNHLCTAYWSWHALASTFKNKNLCSKTPLSRAKSMRLIGQHACWCKMLSIKRQTPTDIAKATFALSRYKKYLEILGDQIALELSNSHPELYDNDSEPNERQPYQYQLYLDDIDLWFAIQWIEGEKVEPFCIARFHFESSTHNFIKQLATIMTTTKIETHGRSSADLINRASLKGELRNIFFGNSTTHSVVFNGCMVKGKDSNGVDIINLIKEVSSLHEKNHSPEPPMNLLFHSG